jgi:DNA polymerase (family 10)
MKLSEALKTANQVKSILEPHCLQIEIAGSIRRRKEFVHDIDLVVIPSNQGAFITALQGLGKITVGGQKLIRCDHSGISLDVYIATPETWATLLLIRTGSKEHNIKLCKLAISKGMKLHADGSGLFSVAPDLGPIYQEARIAGDTEESIFEALGIPYKKPESRN